MSTLTPYSTDSGIGYILLADGVMDRFLQGRDVMDNRSSEDTGNYGLDYTIHLRTQGTGDIHLYFNPQGGEYAGVTELIYSDPQRGEDKKSWNCRVIVIPWDSMTPMPWNTWIPSRPGRI